MWLLAATPYSSTLFHASQSAEKQGMVMDTPDISTYQDELAEQRRRFSEAVTELRGLVGRGPEYEFIGSAAQIGLVAALEDIERDPAGYGMSKPLYPDLLAQLHAPLEAAYEANDRMEAIVDVREATLTAANPMHERVMIHMGREFTYNTETQSLRYLDTQHSERVAPVHVKTDPEVDLEHEQMLERERERGRGM